MPVLASKAWIIYLLSVDWRCKDVLFRMRLILHMIQRLKKPRTSLQYKTMKNVSLTLIKSMSYTDNSLPSSLVSFTDCLLTMWRKLVTECELTHKVGNIIHSIFPVGGSCSPIWTSILCHLLKTANSRSRYMTFSKSGRIVACPLLPLCHWDHAKSLDDSGTTTTSTLRLATHTYRNFHGADRLKTILRPLVVSCFPLFRGL